MYVAIEGIDTCGKSTQIERLKGIFSDAIFTKEPGGSKLGVVLREILLDSTHKLDSMAELFLFLADRAQHFKQIIEPNKHKLIISDRSCISGIAYAKDITLQTSIELNKIALKNTLPDLVIILNIDKENLAKRISNKQNDSIESRGIEYLLDIQNRLFESVKALGIKYISIDAAKNKTQITEQITRAINAMCSM